MTFSCEKQGRVVAVLEGPLGHETRQGRSREVRCTALAIINKPAALLCDLLQSEPNTPVLEQGCANEATSSRPREHRSEARPRRPASSLRSYLISDRDKTLRPNFLSTSASGIKISRALLVLSREKAYCSRTGTPPPGDDGKDTVPTSEHLSTPSINRTRGRRGFPAAKIACDLTPRGTS